MQPQALGEQNPRRTRVHAWVKAGARPGGPVSDNGRSRPPVGRAEGSDRVQTQVGWPQPSGFFAMVSPLS